MLRVYKLHSNIGKCVDVPAHPQKTTQPRPESGSCTLSSSLETSNTGMVHYVLVVTYAVVELLLHPTERFLRCLDLSVLLSVSLSTRVLLWCVGFLSDIQEVRPQLFQLTACDASQCSVEYIEAEDTAVVYGRSIQVPKWHSFMLLSIFSRKTLGSY
jgi:hypothetical protein